MSELPAAMIERGLRPVAILGAEKPHGVRLRYMAGCRCLPCRMANANYETARSKARRAGEWNGVVDAAEARQHILRLGRAGVGYKVLADSANVARSVVAKIRSGERTRARAMSVKRILAVTTACRSDAALVSAAGTWRYIGLLREEGYTKAAIARMLGCKNAALQIRKDRVTVRTAARVAALYRKVVS